MTAEAVCECGCGKPTKIAPRNHTKRGWIKGQPMRFVRGHTSSKTYHLDHRSVEIDPETGCHNWQGSLGTKGYGQSRYRGKAVRTHIWFYEQQHGPVPKGLVLDHLCRNLRCCNPKHLEPVTNTVNTRRGRSAKLTTDQVRLIRMLQGSTTVYDVATEFSVSINCVYSVWSRRRWNDLL